MKLHQACRAFVLSFTFALSIFNASAADQDAELKVLICPGDYGMWAQKRAVMLEEAVAKSKEGVKADWSVEQSFNFVKKLEAPGWANQFDVIVFGDLSLAQITPLAQENLIKFAKSGGGIVNVIWAKSGKDFRYVGERDANPMPLASYLPYEYPNSETPLKESKVYGTDAKIFQGFDFSLITEPASAKHLSTLLMERKVGKGVILSLSGAFGPSYSFEGKETWVYREIPGGWQDWPMLGDLWSRILKEAAKDSPVRALSTEKITAEVKNEAASVSLKVNAVKEIDEIRAANFSVVALQQLYIEDKGEGEELLLELNPKGWYDRPCYTVLTNSNGEKVDKESFLREYDIKGVYMANNTYGNYKEWDDAKFKAEVDEAVGAIKKYSGIIEFFQAGNEPPLDQSYLDFEKKLVKAVLANAPEYKVVGPNKAFNLMGVNPQEMRAYIDQCGSTTDILNWHTYGQPPDMSLAEARYWSKEAKGKMRGKGEPQVMFTETDVWNQGDSQFNYLMLRAYTFLPEPLIAATFHYCLKPRSEGGSYVYGVLSPEGEFSANYNGYWIWRDLRGKMVETAVSCSPVEVARNVHAISSISEDKKTVTTVVYYDTGYFNWAEKERVPKVKVNVEAVLPSGDYETSISEASWNSRNEKSAGNVARVEVELEPCKAVAVTWRKK